MQVICSGFWYKIVKLEQYRLGPQIVNLYFHVLAWRERVAAERKKEGGSVKDEEAEGALDTSRDCQQRARK